ncbi:phospholipase D-like domain-containing protein [Candidatus Nitrososphaera sp. FF02]|uniref:phospholipase D-like domain-containing protein n=1 Tax=Candidatus Nitrososphaera sp. FF02 TaxID=3398226 RepID=UPI0039EB5A24
MYHHISRAERSVFIANYDLDPALRFARSYVAEDGEAVIKSRCAADLAAAGLAGDSKKHSLEQLLVRRAKHGVDIKVIVWQPRLLFRSLPGADERGIDGRAEEVEGMEKLAERLSMRGSLEVRVDSTAPAFTSAHHEKIIIIDGKIGFCGGLDLSRGKWDTPNHDYDSSLRDHGSEPWHDVHAMVRGPVVADLTYHFLQRWHYTKNRDAAAARSIEPPQVEGRPAGGIPVTALRTWKEFDRTGGIRAWYAGMFRSARSGIYIENQFPFQDAWITGLLVKRLQADSRLRVVILGPLEPNLPGLVGKILAGVSIHDVHRNLARLAKAGGQRVGIYCLVSQSKAQPFRRRQIYVHSKLMIVDDRWITVGSANLDKNGMRDSSEVNLGMTSPKLARELRVRLWSEHTSGHVRTLDFGAGFDALDRLAAENGDRVAKNEPIHGHLYYYDFEAHGAPEPYPGAADAKELAIL